MIVVLPAALSLTLALPALVRPPSPPGWAPTTWASAPWLDAAGALGEGPVDLEAGQTITARIAPRGVVRVTTTRPLAVERRCASDGATVIRVGGATPLADGGWALLQGPWGACHWALTATGATTVHLTRPRATRLDLAWDTARVAMATGAALPAVPHAASLDHERRLISAVPAPDAATQAWAAAALRLAWLRRADWRSGAVAVRSLLPDEDPEGWTPVAPGASLQVPVPSAGAIRLDARGGGAVRLEHDGERVALVEGAGRALWIGPPGPSLLTVRVEGTPAEVRLVQGRARLFAGEPGGPAAERLVVAEEAGGVPATLARALRVPASACAGRGEAGAVGAWLAGECDRPTGPPSAVGLSQALAAWRAAPTSAARRADLRAIWRRSRWWGLEAPAAPSTWWLQAGGSTADPSQVGGGWLRRIEVGAPADLMVGPDPYDGRRRRPERLLIGAPTPGPVTFSVNGVRQRVEVGEAPRETRWSLAEGPHRLEVHGPPGAWVATALATDPPRPVHLRRRRSWRLSADPIVFPLPEAPTTILRLAVRGEALGAAEVRVGFGPDAGEAMRVELAAMDPAARLDGADLTAEAVAILTAPRGARQLELSADRPLLARVAWRGVAGPFRDAPPIAQRGVEQEALSRLLEASRARAAAPEQLSPRVAQANLLVDLDSHRAAAALEALRPHADDPRVSAAWARGQAARRGRRAWVPAGEPARAVLLDDGSRPDARAALAEWRATGAWRHGRAALAQLGRQLADPQARLLADGLLRAVGAGAPAPIPDLRSAVRVGTRWQAVSLPRAPAGEERVIHGLPLAERSHDERIAYALAAPPWPEAEGQVISPGREAVRGGPGRWIGWCAPGPGRSGCRIGVPGRWREIAAYTAVELAEEAVGLQGDDPAALLALRATHRGATLPLRRGRRLFRAFPGAPVQMDVQGPTTLELFGRGVHTATTRPAAMQVEITGPRARSVTIALPPEPDPEVRGRERRVVLGRVGRASIFLPEVGSHRVVIRPDRGEAVVRARVRVADAAGAGTPPTPWPRARRPFAAPTDPPGRIEPIRLPPVRPMPIRAAWGTVTGALSLWRALALEEEEAFGDTPGRDLAELSAAWRRRVGEGLHLRGELAARQGEAMVVGGRAAARLRALPLPGGRWPGLSARLAGWSAPTLDLWSVRGRASLFRPLGIAPDWWLTPSVGGHWTALADVEGGTRDLDPVLGTRWRRDHPHGGSLALSLRGGRWQDHRLGARVAALTNPDLVSLDRVGGELAWWGVFGLSATSTLEARARWRPRYWLADADREDAGLAHMLSVGLEASLWSGPSGRYRLGLDGGPSWDRRGRASVNVTLGLAFDWVGGRGLLDFDPLEARFSRLVERRFVSEEGP